MNKVLVGMIVVVLCLILALAVYSYTVTLDTFGLNNITFMRVVTVDPDTQEETVEWKMGANYTMSASGAQSISGNEVITLTTGQATTWETFLKPKLAALTTTLETPNGEDWIYQ